MPRPDPATTSDRPAAPATPPTAPLTADQLHDLVRRAQAGDASILPTLRSVLDDPKLMARLENGRTAAVERAFLDAMGGTDLLFKEALTRTLATMRADLAGDRPTPVERLLSDRVVACWLQVQEADLRYARERDLGGKRAAALAARLDGANKRFLAAARTLAQVRKLAVPVVQVNIARRQVNVAGGVVPAAGGGD